jgi:regulator of cell morphogenesis and NO signaling
MAIDPGVIVRDLVIAHPSRIPVLESFGIDYCCGGDQPLETACRAAAIDPTVVLAAIDEADAVRVAANDTPERDWTEATLRELIAEIVDRHHAYLRRELPRVAELLAKVRAAHAANHPELNDVAAVFGLLRNELEDHLVKEERMLFPMIEAMEVTRSIEASHCGSVRNPIGVMEHEHDGAGEALRTLRTLTSDYTPPGDACASYHALLSGLADLERDLHEHIHKENNLLHPRAIELEASLLPTSDD